MTSRNQRPASPCVGLCSTTYGDSVCRGCQRFSHEVVHWNRYDDAQKQAVWGRLKSFREQVMRGRVDVVDTIALEKHLRAWDIPFRDDDGEGVRAYELLRRKAQEMLRLEDYGLRARPDFEQFAPPELLSLVERDLRTLAEAHYERYIQVDLWAQET